jgi:hypothetical protein
MSITRLMQLGRVTSQSNNTFVRLVRQHPQAVVGYLTALVVAWVSILNIGSKPWMWIVYVIVAFTMAFLMYTWPRVDDNGTTMGR